MIKHVFLYSKSHGETALKQ